MIENCLVSYGRKVIVMLFQVFKTKDEMIAGAIQLGETIASKR